LGRPRLGAAAGENDLRGGRKRDRGRRFGRLRRLATQVQQRQAAQQQAEDGAGNQTGAPQEADLLLHLLDQGAEVGRRRGHGPFLQLPLALRERERSGRLVADTGFFFQISLRHAAAHLPVEEEQLKQWGLDKWARLEE
jgi:hypothetical protein